MLHAGSFGEQAPWVEHLLALPFLLLLVAYLLAAHRCRHRGRHWPARRTGFWLLGTASCLVAVTGPLAQRAETSFAGHMVVHLLLGMVGPLLLVHGAPVTLALRALPVAPARRLVGVLASRPVRFLSHPVTAAVASVGALFLLYGTELYAVSREQLALHLVVHAHLFGFGYLFAASLVGVDPDRHRASFGFRAGVLVLYGAAHSVLAKRLYAVPPAGVTSGEAELGAQVLYYGSDAVDLAVMVLLCYRWYVVSDPRRSRRLATTGSRPLPAPGRG